MNNWQELKLKELCERVTVGHVGSMADQYIESGIPFLRSQNIRPFGLDLSDIKFIGDEFHRKLKKSALNAGDVVVVRTGYPGTAAVVPPSLGVANCSDLVIIRPSKALNPYFLAAIFNSAFGQTLVSGNTVGAAQQHFNITVAKELRLKFPDKPTQNRIAAILSAYDELIENNKRRIALLEKMAEEIYREWFVLLRFPGHEAAKFEKGMPCGWERTKVSVLASYIKRGVAPHYDDSAPGIVINQKCIRDGAIDLTLARRQSREVGKERHVQFGDVLVNSTGEGTLGRVAQVLFDKPNCIVDSHVTIVRPKSETPIYYFGITMKKWESHFSTMGRGSTNQTELSPSIIGGMEVTVPSKTLRDKYEEIAAPFFQQAAFLRGQLRLLAAARDALLPRLISGKFSVENLDIQFPPSMKEEDALTPALSRDGTGVEAARGRRVRYA